MQEGRLIRNFTGGVDLFRSMIDRVILTGMFFGVVAPLAVLLLLWLTLQ